MQQNPKNTNTSIDSGLFINCLFDTDYLEVSKTESLRKYEENIYLLGTIFSKKKEKENQEDKEKEKENEDSFTINDEESSESIDEEILKLFENKNPNKNFEGDIENIDHIIAETKFETNEEHKLLGQLKSSLEDFKETFNFLKNKKDNYLEELKEHNDFNQKLRGTKNSENEIEDLFKKADSKKLVPSAFKQQNNLSLLNKKRTNDNKSSEVNKDLPFLQNDNLTVMNL